METEETDAPVVLILRNIQEGVVLLSEIDYIEKKKRSIIIFNDMCLLVSVVGSFDTIGLKTCTS